MVMMMFACHGGSGRWRIVMSRAARCLHNCGKPLSGQRSYQKPKQQCLEGTNHEASLPCGRMAENDARSLALPIAGRSRIFN